MTRIHPLDIVASPHSLEVTAEPSPSPEDEVEGDKNTTGESTIDVVNPEQEKLDALEEEARLAAEAEQLLLQAKIEAEAAALQQAKLEKKLLERANRELQERANEAFAKGEDLPNEDERKKLVDKANQRRVEWEQRNKKEFLNPNANLYDYLAISEDEQSPRN